MGESKSMDIRDLLNSFANLHVSTLERAALISPQIKGRTIGPDIDSPMTNGFNKSKPDKLPAGLAANKTPTPDEHQNEITASSPANKTDRNASMQNRNSSFVIFPLQSPSAQEIAANIARRAFKREYLKNKRKEKQECEEKYANVLTQLRNANRPDPAELERFVEQHNQQLDQMMAAAEEYAAQAAAKLKAERNAFSQTSEQRIKRYAMKTVLSMQEKFRPKYEETVRLLLSEKHRMQNAGEYNQILKNLVSLFDTIIQRLKTDDCTESEIMLATNLYNSLEDLHNKISSDVENILKKEEKERVRKQKEQEELQKQHKLEQEKKEAEAAAQAQAAADAASAAEAAAAASAANAAAPSTQQTSATSAQSTDFIAPDRLQFYEQITSYYHEKVESVKPLQAIEAMKKWRTLCQRAINIPINAISPQSPQFLQDKFDKLYSFIAGHPYRGADNQTISITDHPLGRDYCLLLMAKKFVNQGETAISSNPQQAFAIATIVVSLWKLVPDFGILFLAYLFKESPLLAPYFTMKRSDQTDEDYMKFLGYRYADGKIEDNEVFLKRLAGMARLYAAVMVTQGRKQDAGQQHPFGPDQGWMWLANVIRVPPLPGISSTLLVEVLQTIGADMYATYRDSFVKLISTVQQEYFPRLAAVDAGGPLARLELMLNNFLREGQLPRPQGMIPNGFW